MLGKKGCELVKGDKIHAVVKIHMTCARDHIEFLRFSRKLVGVFAELSGMSVITRYKKERGEIVSMSANG